MRREASEAFAGVVGRLLEGATLGPLPQAHKGPYCPPAGWITQRRALRNYARALRQRPHGALPDDHEEHIRLLPG